MRTCRLRGAAAQVGRGRPLEAPAAQQAVEKEEEIEEIFTPSVAADLQGAEGAEAQGLRRARASGEEESEEERAVVLGLSTLGRAMTRRARAASLIATRRARDSDEARAASLMASLTQV